MSRKRPRIAPRGQRRPIDKDLIVVLKTISASQQASTLKTTTFPCTLVGLRWDLSLSTILTTTTSFAVWAIVIVTEGDSANAMSTSDASSFYTPEQNVLTFGISTFPDADVGNGPNVVNWNGNTKTMRKLKAGDTVQFIVQGSAAAQGSCHGIVQFFCKS